MTPSTHASALSPITRAAEVGTRPIERLGFWLVFTWHAVSAVPHTIRHYGSETYRAIHTMTWGRGGLIVGGGTVPMMIVLGAAIGASIGIEALAALDLIGLGPMTGVVAAVADTRELAPIAAAFGFAAQAGCRMTAEIGSMRISEEIDAVEALGVRSIPFVVTTRLIGGAVAMVPTFLIALLTSYWSCRLVVTAFNGQASGVYEHYFDQFVSGADIAVAVAKVFVFSVAVILIHCYQGFFATGGPEGVGVSSGRAVRASFVIVVVLDMLMTLVVWGVDSTIEFTG